MKFTKILYPEPTQISDLEKVREWLKGFDGLPSEFAIDYTNEVPGNAGLFPNGLVEISRKENIVGDIVVTNQYNFAIYMVFPKMQQEDIQATINAEWVMNLQKWVQEQSVKGLAPTFGNVAQEQEQMKAQNGMFYGSKDDGAGLYMITLTAQFKQEYKN